MWEKAVQLASQYQLVIASEPGVGFLGRTVEMPFAMGDGATIEDCAAAVLDATACGIAALLESGETPPAPAREGKRDQQVNIRLTAEERLTLESLANREGFRSVSDYVRSAALGRTSPRR